MNALNIARSRHACKAYDETRTIDDTLFLELIECLRLSPSSINIQPWRFLIAKTDVTKARIATAMTGTDAHNAPKVMKASHVLIFCANTQINDEHLDKVINAEDLVGRFRRPEDKVARQALCKNYLNAYANDSASLHAWINEQIYIALGQLLFCAKMMGIDATPIGGFDKAVLDKEFNLSSQGMRSVVVASLGYASDEDFNKNLPKARLSANEVFVNLDG